MMASRMLKHDRELKHGRLYRASERAFNWMRDTYGTALRWVLEHEWLMLAATGATIAFTVYLYIVIPKGLFPQQDTGSLAGGSQAPQDISFPAMKARTEALNAVVDANLDELTQWAPRVLEKLRSLPQLRDVNTDQQTNGLRLDVTVDRDTASRLGITPQAIDETLYDAFGQRQVATMYTQLNQYRVVLEVKPEFQVNPSQVQMLYVRTPSGGQVPLSALAK